MLKLSLLLKQVCTEKLRKSQNDDVAVGYPFDLSSIFSSSINQLVLIAKACLGILHCIQLYSVYTYIGYFVSKSCLKPVLKICNAYGKQTPLLHENYTTTHPEAFLLLLDHLVA